MYETLRMLGEQHEADLERQARNGRLAATVRTSRRAARASRTRIPRRTWAIVLRARLSAILR